MATPEEHVEVQEVKEKRQVGGRQLVLILGGVLVLVLLLWFLFLRGGDEEPTTAAPPVPPPATTPAPDAGEDGGDEEGKPGGGPVETFEVFAPKDPFDPLLTEDVGGGTGETTETTDSGDTTGTDTTGTTDTGTDTDGDGVTDTDTGDTGEIGDDTTDVQGHRVELVSTLDGGRAQVQVDDTVYTVDEGERFAENFELVSVSAECATLLFGDDQFTLCEGEEILK
jgi:hypothetical protein